MQVFFCAIMGENVENVFLDSILGLDIALHLSLVLARNY